MPLFIFISGYFFHPSAPKMSFKNFLIKKFFHLYLPSLFWGGFNVLLIIGNKLLNNSNIDIPYFIDLFFSGAWFLTALFIINLIGGIIESCNYRKKIRIWIFCYFIIYSIPPLWMINEIKFLMPFFITGILIKRFEITRIPIYFFIIMLILFTLCFHFYDFSYSLYAMQYNIIEVDYHFKSLIRFLSGFSGIVCISFLCHYLSPIFIQKLKSFLTYMGTITLPIYVLHQNLLIPNRFLQYQSDSIIIILLITIICILLSIITYKVLCKFTILKLLCFGEK